MYFWRNVFTKTPRVGSYDLARMQTYILVSFVVSSITFTFVVFGVINLVRTVAIATVLTRPICFMYAQLTEAVGDATIRGMVSLIIAVLLSVIFFHAQLPASPLAALFFFVECSIELSGARYLRFLHFTLFLLHPQRPRAELDSIGRGQYFIEGVWIYDYTAGV